MHDKPHALAQPGLASTDPVMMQAARSERQDQRLLMIFDLAKILVAEDDQETMLSRFLSRLIASLDAADAGSLWLYDAAEDRLAAAGARATRWRA